MFLGFPIPLMKTSCSRPLPPAPNPSKNPMNGRDAILGRVREALQLSTDHHVRKQPEPAIEAASQEPNPNALPILPTDPSAERSSTFRAWLPAVGEDYEAQRELFATNSETLKTRFIPLPNREAVLETLGKIKEEEEWGKIGGHRARLSEIACEHLDMPTCWTEPGYDPQELETCDVGITECEALIAQTGSVLITSQSSGGRVLSILPPHHVVIAERWQMLPDLAAGYELLKKRYGGNYPSLISFITGPSRTGDIERILVLGAHGPRKLTVLLDESATEPPEDWQR
ncbi:L-lactate dehydrogenase complex protein LldG [Planctomycetales bacterium 10988]|nr:L-lactate dehydrogenase complex protein LldG [Planctomycetales bacterium 10988]